MTEQVHLFYKRNDHIWLSFLRVVLFFLAVSASGLMAASGSQMLVSSQNELSAKIAKKGDIAPREKVPVVFSEKVDPSSIEEGFSISPNIQLALAWTNDNQELDLKPSSHFDPGKKYSVSIKVKEGLFKNKENEIKISFQIEDYPKVIKVDPGKDKTDINVESDFFVSFEKPTKNFDVSFKIVPFDNFDYEANEEKTEFRIFSAAKLQYETDYKLTIFSQVAGSENEKKSIGKEIFSGTFKTEKKPVASAARSNSAIIPEDQVVDLEARILSGKYIDINLAKQHLSIFDDGSRLGTYRVSTGKRGMATPTGNFKILGKRGRAWSSKYKLYMPYFMQFTGAGHGIHELPEWPGGYKEGVAHLGIPVSHGCVRLGIGPAQTVYNWAEIGTPVVIHY